MVTFTWNNIVKYFETIAENHYQIKGFGSGFVDDIQATLKKNINYPFMYLIPLDDTVRENTNDARVGVIIVDLVKEDQRNQLEVLSDTNLIVKDIIKILRNEEVSNIQVLDEPTMEPFKERYADDTTGWVVEMSLQINFPNNYCDIPSDIFGPGGTETGLPSFSTNFLTCETLEDCDRIISILAELADHEARITALEEGGGGGLTCDDLDTCQVIIDLQGQDQVLDSRISDAEAAIQSLNSTITDVTVNLQGQIDANTNDINQLITDVTNLEGSKLNKSDFVITLQGYAADTTINTNNFFIGRILSVAAGTTWQPGRSMVSMYTGTLIGAVCEFSGNAGSNEATTISIRLNDATDINITTTADFSQTYHVYHKMDLNQSITAFVDQMQLKIHARTRATPAGSTRSTVYLIIRPTL